jgi:hypothetical protein
MLRTIREGMVTGDVRTAVAVRSLSEAEAWWSRQERATALAAIEEAILVYRRLAAATRSRVFGSAAD